MGVSFLYTNLYTILLILCIISRILTSIFYIEDIDSLRFAYSIVDEYNLLKLQPHFPGYAIFCFIAKILYMVFGNMGFVFSLIGGASTFIIIYFSLKLLDSKLYSKEGLFLLLLIFFNPMFWLMANRYMPDLMGLSALIASFYLITQKEKQHIILGGLMIGILAGIRISYLPFLIYPTLLILIKRKNTSSFIVSGLCGVLIWLVPLIWVTGYQNLYLTAHKHLLGHFTEYGGTILTENSWHVRLQYLIHTIWSDGFGGYWYNRSLITLILSFLLIPIFILTSRKIKFLFYNNSVFKYLILSSIIYLIWIFFFQNIIYKSRHVMPLVLVMILFVSAIFSDFLQKKNHLISIYTLLLFTFMSYTTIKLSTQHKEPTAINKLSQYLINRNEPLVISVPLINYYLKSQNLSAEFMDIEYDAKEIDIDLDKIDKEIIVIGDFTEKINGFNIVSEKSFHHNPYVNRMWSTINLYSNSIENE